MAATDALILDFDGSVLPLPGSRRLPLADRQEDLRFSCSLRALNGLDDQIGAAIKDHAVAFLGSGDYHHISHLLIRRHARIGQALQVVVFDNHPDNMRYPFGIHCGSWVWHVSRLPFVACVHVLGIASADVAARHAWENHLRPLRAGKIRYWCVGQDLGWTRRLGIFGSDSWPSGAALLDAFAAYIATTAGPVYLSIDKDVLPVAAVHTNWDQGVLTLAELGWAIRLLRPRLIGCDVTGEVSVYRYRGLWKRLFSSLDGQATPAAADLGRWQAEHQAVNLRLLDWLRADTP
jgi:arginase family enzyme